MEAGFVIRLPSPQTEQGGFIWPPCLSTFLKRLLSDPLRRGRA